VLSVRKNSPVIWKPLGVITVPEGATLSAMEWFHSPNIIATDLFIIIIIILYYFYSSYLIRPTPEA
jgi:hypothetical protein